MKKVIFLSVISLLLFGACKKYPENTLWFKKPEKVFKGGYITVYTIDGVDKMQDIRKLYHDFPFNLYGTPIDDVLSLPINFDGESLRCDYGEGSLAFSDSKKSVRIKFTPVNAQYGAQNIFIQNDNWEVLKLTKGGQMKLQARFGPHTYVIQFN